MERKDEHDEKRKEKYRRDFEREENIARWGGGMFWGIGIWLVLGLIVLAVNRCIG